MNDWIILAILGGLFSSLFNFGYRYVLKANGDSSLFSWWFEVLRVSIFMLILPFDYWLEISHKSLFLLSVLGLIEFFSIYFYSKMHKESQLSVSTIIIRLRIVWIPIFAFILTNEKLTLEKYLGILIIFLGLSFVSSPKKFFYDKGIVLAFVCSIITAILSVVTKEVSNYASTSIILISMGLPSMILFPLLVGNWKVRAKAFYTKSIYGVFAVSLASVATVYFQIKAFKLGSVSEVMGIYQAMSLVAVLGGIFILGEKENVRQKIVGSIVVMIGAYLLL